MNDIEIILPSNENEIITKNFINAFELSLYKKNNQELSFNISLYSGEPELQKIIKEKVKPGKIFIGPLTSKDTKNIHQWCESGAIFFSFASDRNLASDCIYLVNFFPEDEIDVLFKFFEENKKVALLYPDNDYGNYINKIIDDIANSSKSIVISKVAYKEDLTDARDSIKKLGKYDMRKKELERQKNILKNKNDDVSKKALKKIEKFETIGELDFSHLIIADYNIRLLQIAPLLPFYDVDPQKVQFVGMGVWDDKAFFNEPSLQGAVFPGVSAKKRSLYINEYINYYEENPIRTITIPYDLLGLLNFILEKKHTIDSAKKLLNNNSITYDGIDGKFSFKNNLIKRELNILKINKGKTEVLESF